MRAFEEGIQQKAVHMGENALTGEERIVLAVQALDREVNNGGYDQFFRNTSRRFAPIIVGALKRMGCDQESRQTQRALECLRVPVLRVEDVQSAMKQRDESRDQELDRCDRLFYEIPNQISKRLYGFIKDNKARVKL